MTLLQSDSTGIWTSFHPDGLFGVIVHCVTGVYKCFVHEAWSWYHIALLSRPIRVSRAGARRWLSLCTPAFGRFILNYGQGGVCDAQGQPGVPLMQRFWVKVRARPRVSWFVFTIVVFIACNSIIN